MINIKLPDNWYNFKIVETVDGSFTGQITYDKMSKEEIDNWETKGRVELQRITKEYLESLIGYKIEKWTGLN